MMNKRGYIKTLEAVISIVGILIFTFGMTPRELSNPNEVPFVVENALKYVMSTISSEESIRQQVFNGDPAGNESIFSLIVANVPPGYAYEVQVCSETTCLAQTPPPNVSVYSDDIIIAGTDASGDAQVYIIRVWMWQAAQA